MTAPASARVERWRGEAAVVLEAGEWQAVYLPELGLLGGSLTHDGRELLARPGGLAAVRHDHTTALPLLHPWANRLSRRRYRAAGVDVDLRGVSVHTDSHGLPIHGAMLGRRGWHVTRLGASARAARLGASFDFGAHPDLLATFPFPHRLTVEVVLSVGGLRVVTALRPTGRVPVPVSFGLHPYLRLPGAARRAWRVELPAAAHLALDRRGIPTGSARAHDARTLALGADAYDDLYALGPDRRVTLRASTSSRATPRLTVTLDAGYPYVQLYAPAGAAFCCIEPMTAPTDALVTGDAPLIAPGAEFRAGFTISFAG